MSAGWYVLIAVGVLVLGTILFKAIGSSSGHGCQNGEKGMFKSMKLGTKIATGFAGLLVIAMVLGGLSVWSMNGVKATSIKLANLEVPKAKESANIASNFLEAGI